MTLAAPPSPARPAGRTWSGLIVDLLDGRDLRTADTGWAMERVVRGEATSAQIAGFLVALRAKGETAAEIAGLAAAVRAQATPVEIPGPVVDIVGTGGDRLGVVNVSTMAAIVVASTGVTVVKHGGRAASSPTGGAADLVEALGIRLDHSPAEAARVASAAGIAFLHAPQYNPSLRQVAAVRRELAVPTAFNVLAPLISPADPGYGLVGVADARLLPVVAGVLAAQGRSALVVRGEDGLDKLTTTGPSRVFVVRDGAVVETVLDPRSLGLPLRSVDELRSPDAVGVARRFLAGERGAVRDVVLLNAAAALSTLPDAAPIEVCLEQCAAAVDSGAAAATLERWVAVA
ncbi:anthranilate phosphoribosyltransferase [Kribbella amoyensis]|uniref:Anthranilate phosphoribosyltransferase n=1 Tax=Kribbella amoyensis TaxID=996641 RepID=A0A561BPN1_9ACTN|nr:anthranilate phosphoribosyltransferase [Kribbella amoyensis]TWD80816.1 anthranilate phosphoribosyltransferase [Kribbella amoyensis]